jgi:hypothetical protein
MACIGTASVCQRLSISTLHHSPNRFAALEDTVFDGCCIVSRKVERKHCMVEQNCTALKPIATTRGIIQWNSAVNYTRFKSLPQCASRLSFGGQIMNETDYQIGEARGSACRSWDSI